MAVETLCIISLLSNFQTTCIYQLTTTGSGTGMFNGWWTSVKSRLPNCSVSSNSFNSTIFFGKPWRIKSSAWNIHKPTDQLKRLRTYNDLQFTDVLGLMRTYQQGHEGWGLWPSGMLHSTTWWVEINVLGQPIGSIFKGQAVQENCQLTGGCLIIQGMVWTVTAYQGRYRSQPDCWGVKMLPGHGGRKNVRLDPLPSLRTNHHPHQHLYNKASTHGLAFLLDCLHLENGTDRLSKNVGNYQHMLGIALQADSIPNGVIEFFHSHIPSGHAMSLGLTQPLTGIFPGG